MAKKRVESKVQAATDWAEILRRVLLFLTAFFLFALPLFILPGISEYGYGKSMFALIGVSVLVILWAIRAWISGRWEIRVPWVLYPLAAFVLIGLFSTIPAMNARVVIQSLVLVVAFAVFMLLIANVVRERKDVHLLLSAVLISAFLVALYGMLQYLGVMRGPTGDSGGLGQIISTLGNRNFLGGFFAYLLFPGAILVVQAKSRWVRAAVIPMLAFAFGMAMMIGQQGVILALILAAVTLVVGLIIFRPVGPIRRSRVWILVFLLFIVVSFLFQAPSGPLNSVVAQSAEATTWIGRIWQQYGDAARTWDWLIGIDMFKHSPLVGVGLGNYKLNFLPYKVAFLQGDRASMFDFYIPRAAQAHNEYVQVLAEAGSLGFLSVAGLLVLLVMSFWGRMRSAESEDVRLDLLLLACGIVTYLAHAFVSFPAHLPASVLTLVLFVGLAFSQPYGTRFVHRFRISGWAMRGTAIAVVAFSVVVSVLAASDLSANLLMSEGQRQYQLGNAARAEALFQRSLRYDFAPRQTYFHLAVAQIQLGKNDEAWENLERCFTRFVDEAVYLTYANLAISRGAYEEGQEAVEFLLASGVEDKVQLQARYIQAGLSTQRGEYSKATGQLLQLIADAPTYELAYVALADIYAAQGNTELARAKYEKALQLVESKLQAATNRLSKLTETTVARYGQLRSSIDSLTQQRSLILARLERLP